MCIRDRSQNRMTDYVFNWDKMLALQGDTAPYLQNSYVRVRSIFRKLDGGPLDWSAPIQLSEDAEIHLARLLARYGEVVPQVLDCLLYTSFARAPRYS